MLEDRRIDALAPFEQAAAQRHVPGGDEEQPPRGGAVAPRPPDLLVVRLDRARRREVYDAGWARVYVTDEELAKLQARSAYLR